MFGWGALSARLERFDVTAPIAFVVAGLLLTHGPLAFLSVTPSKELIKELVGLGRRGLPGAGPLVSWLTVGPGVGLGGPGIRRGVVAVRCPACTAEQRLQGQQGHASHCHPDTSSGQDVQGIVHP